MRQLASMTSLIAFLLHVLLGCCTHHAHAAQPVEGAQRSEVVCHHACHHSQPPDSQPHQDPNSPDERCDEADCVFASCAKLELAKDSLEAGAPFDTLSYASALLLLQANRPLSDSGATWKPPLRSHLLLRVLLI